MRELATEEAAHVEEELGDLLFQIVFHAELGDEEDLFNFATIADGVRDKLTGRHPHVFGDMKVSGSNEVAARWEVLKRDEKGRESVTDGIAWQLPALILYTKLLRKAALVDLGHDGEASRDERARARRDRCRWTARRGRRALFVGRRRDVGRRARRARRDGPVGRGRPRGRLA